MEEESTHQSRLFVILAIALIGLLVLGLLGIGGVFVIRQNLQEQAALTQPSPTTVIRLPNPSVTPTPIEVSATNTPAPTPTNTPVLNADGTRISGEAASVGGSSGSDDDSDSEQAITLPRPAERTPIAGAAAASSADNTTAGETPTTVPNTGLGGLEAVLIAAGLVLVLFVARRMRTSL